MTPYRILFTLARYWPAVGGSELHTRELAQHLKPWAESSVLCHNSASGISNELACAQADTRVQEDQGIPVSQHGPQGLRRTLLQGLALAHPHTRVVRPLYDQLFRPLCRGALRDASQDQELIHAVYNGMTTHAEEALAVARERGLPFVWTPLAHTHAPAGSGWASSRFRRLYREADALIAMTDYERDWLIQHGAQPSRTHVCPVGPLLGAGDDPAAFRLAQGLGQAPLVLFLGRHARTKGYQELAQAAPAIWARHPEARLLFIGPQTDASRRFFQAWNDPRIRVIDHLSEQKKNAALAACDLLCVPSTQESLGVTYLEAWHYGKPVIGADIEVLRTVIQEGRDGLLVQPAPEPIAAAVCALLDDPARREAMGRHGQARTRSRYHWPAIAARLAGIYGDLLGRAPAQRIPV